MRLLLYASIAVSFASCGTSNSSDRENSTLTNDSVAVCHMSSAIPSRFTAVTREAEMLGNGIDEGDMILIEGGVFKMGTTNFPDTQPVHEVEISSFYMDVHEVTNAQFEKFVTATGYQTVAERPLDPKEFPGVDPSLLVPGSAVFTSPEGVQGLQDHLQWWEYVPEANWRHPEGPGSSIVGRESHPVTQVAYEDAIAYAEWAGKRLPTEAEWEYAAKAGKHQNETYYWGDEKLQEGKWLANIYQGEFPSVNTKEDGFDATAPVKSFPANAFGLYDMEGNVWEWCLDYYRPDYYENSPKNNPVGPSSSYDPQEPGAVKRVQRGGSFLCNDAYCERYKAGARGKGEVNSPTNNVGFRCVKDAH